MAGPHQAPRGSFSFHRGLICNGAPEPMSTVVVVGQWKLVMASKVSWCPQKPDRHRLFSSLYLWLFFLWGTAMRHEYLDIFRNDAQIFLKFLWFRYYFQIPKDKPNLDNHMYNLQVCLLLLKSFSWGYIASIIPMRFNLTMANEK